MKWNIMGERQRKLVNANTHNFSTASFSSIELDVHFTHSSQPIELIDKPR